MRQVRRQDGRPLLVMQVVRSGLSSANQTIFQRSGESPSSELPRTFFYFVSASAERVNRIRFQRSKIEGAFFVRKISSSPLQETLTLAGIHISQGEMRVPAKAISS
jgi:hypothetical protein